MSKFVQADSAPVDREAFASEWAFFKAKPDVDDDGQQKVDKRTHLLSWHVVVAREDDDGIPEFLKVKVLAPAMPEVHGGQPADFENLVAHAWGSGNRSGLWFSADGVAE